MRFQYYSTWALANIVRRLNLSWQECAQYVGLSAYELYGQGNIDGVVDYSPSEKSSSPDNLRLAIVGAISNVEGRVKEFVSENPYILDHYRQSLTVISTHRRVCWQCN